MATKQSEADVKKLFNRFDNNGNGKLSLAEIDKAVLELYPTLSSDKRAIMRAYKAADASGDGFVNLREFHKLIDFLYYYNKLGKVFAAADKDNDHRISFAEFAEGYKALGVQSDQAHLKAEFSKIDTNNGGLKEDIMFDEFCSYAVKNNLGH